MTLDAHKNLEKWKADKARYQAGLLTFDEYYACADRYKREKERLAPEQKK
jgi:hypothetical protein